MAEREITTETLLLSCVNALGGRCFKLKFLGCAGAPDRLVLLPGARIFFVELKKPTGTLENSQKVLFPKLESLGFKVHVLYGKPDVEKFIEERKYDGTTN